MPADFSNVNIFQMYVANGELPGFWVRRTTWEDSCARVTSIGPFKGPAPYYGNPIVLADFFDVQTAEMKDEGARLPVPGTYKTWRQMDPPIWARE
jgi:hypothetical protein